MLAGSSAVVALGGGDVATLTVGLGLPFFSTAPQAEPVVPIACFSFPEGSAFEAAVGLEGGVYPPPWARQPNGGASSYLSAR